MNEKILRSVQNTGIFEKISALFQNWEKVLTLKIIPIS